MKNVFSLFLLAICLCGLSISFYSCDSEATSFEAEEDLIGEKRSSALAFVPTPCLPPEWIYLGDIHATGGGTSSFGGTSHKVHWTAAQGTNEYLLTIETPGDSVAVLLDQTYYSIDTNPDLQTVYTIYAVCESGLYAWGPTLELGFGEECDPVSEVEIGSTEYGMMNLRWTNTPATEEVQVKIYENGSIYSEGITTNEYIDLPYPTTDTDLTVVIDNDCGTGGDFGNNTIIVTIDDATQIQPICADPLTKLENCGSVIVDLPQFDKPFVIGPGNFCVNRCNLNVECK